MAYGENIGQPWLHKGVKCEKCSVSPISGFRYQCKKRPDYNLCQACFRREIPDPKVKYLKIERAKSTGPYQVHFIECAECGVAPVKGRRYRHKTQEDCDLCEACFSRATNPSNRRAQPESDYELFEDLVVNSVCKKYDPVFHFEKRCDECLVSPICGPCFTSIKNPDYDLCVFCHDDKLQNDSIRSGDFCSRDKPVVSSVYHLNIICCVHCGTTPIKGPAFKHKRDPNKTLCLVCVQHVQEEKRRFFARIDPPRQAEKGTGSKFPMPQKATTPATKTIPQVPIKTSSTNPPVPSQPSTSTSTSDSNGGAIPRGYVPRTQVNATVASQESTTGTTSAATPSLSTSLKITNRSGVEIKTPPPVVYTAGLKTSSRAQPPSPPLSPPTPATVQQQSTVKFASSSPQPPPAQTALKFSSSPQPSTAPPLKSALKVSFAPLPTTEEQSNSKYSSSQPRQPQQADLNRSTAAPAPHAQQTSSSQYQQGPGSKSGYQGSGQQQSSSSTSEYQAPPGAPASQLPNYMSGASPVQPTVQPPSSQYQAPPGVPPQMPNFIPGGSANYPPTAFDYLAAMTAAQVHDTSQTLAIINALQLEKERSNLALINQLLQNSLQQGPADYSAMTGNTGGAVDVSALLNNNAGKVDYLALLEALRGGGGGDFSLSPGRSGWK